MNLEIEVQVPQATDIEAFTDSIDVSADPGGPQVLIVPTPGPPGPPLSAGEFDLVTGAAADQVLTGLIPPINLTLLFLNTIA